MSKRKRQGKVLAFEEAGSRQHHPYVDIGDGVRVPKSRGGSVFGLWGKADFNIEWVTYMLADRYQLSPYTNERVSAEIAATRAALLNLCSVSGVASVSIDMLSMDALAIERVERCLASLKSVLKTEVFKATERAAVTPSRRYEILKRDRFRCKRCGASADDGAELHVDHIVSIADGGTSIDSNLRALCVRCNLGKGAKSEDKEEPKPEPLRCVLRLFRLFRKGAK